MQNPYSKIEMQVPKDTFLEVLSYHHWRHRIELNDGLFTPGYLTPTYWKLSHFPENFVGKNVLDIGANDGLNSFLMEKYGARSVTSIDIYRDGSDPNHTDGWNPYAIELTKRLLNSKIDIRSKSLFELDPAERQYDVVLLADVMNWLSDIPTALKKISAVCRDTLIIRDGLMDKDNGRPIIEYTNHLSSDALLWLPSATFMEAILKQFGFHQVTIEKIDVNLVFEEWATTFPLITSKGKVRAFETPWSSEPISETDIKGWKGIANVDDRVLVRSVGWVNVKDVTPYLVEMSKFMGVAKRLFGDRYARWLKEILQGNKTKGNSYTIIAKR
jgi:SAM-dependent methyltransferase